MIDCPTGCSLVNGGAALPERQYSQEEAKAYFGMPRGNLVVMSCGRPTKFQDMDFWKAILELLQLHPDVYYVAVGLAVPPSHLQEAMTPDIIGRMKFIGWEKDFLKLLSMADVVVDTYPSGGGATIFDAMSLGTPVVSFKNNYMKIFSQTDWSPAEEFMGIPELLVERGDFKQFHKLLSNLLSNQGFRIRMSELSRKCIVSTSGRPEDMVRECEQVYLKVIEENSGPSLSRVV
jgi:glycosyltransferase involved in cell wall biosynthesis